MPSKKRIPNAEVIPPDFEPVPDFEWNDDDLAYYRHEVRRWRAFRRGDYGVVFLPSDSSASWIYHEIGRMRDVDERGVAARGADGGTERVDGSPTLLVFRWGERYVDFFGAVQRWDHVYVLIGQDEPLRDQSMIPNPTDLQNLDTGDWTPISPINSGSFGQVWKAENSSGKRAALKLLKIEHMDREQLGTFRRHFQRELDLLLRLDSPYTARALDGDPFAAQPWIVTEFIAGEDLESEITHEGPLAGLNWWSLASDLLAGLAVAHELGIVHQDVRPPNVMRGTRGAILVDFGIATQIDRTQEFAKSYIRPRMYSSPEQVQGGRLTPASDIFQAGLTLFFAATARSAFPGKSIEDVEQSLVSRKPAMDGLARTQAAFLLGLLEKRPDNRPTTKDAQASVRREFRELLAEN
jgi:hypothetical protein